MSQIHDFYGDGLRSQKALLKLMGDDAEPPTDQLVIEQALLLTLQHPTDVELELAFQFWAMDQGGHVSKRSGARASIVGVRLTPPKPAFRNLWLNWWDSIAPFRSGLRMRVLEGIGRIENIEKAQAVLELDIDAGALRDILIVPRMWWDGQEVRTDLFYLCPTMESRFTLACVKLLGSKRTAESLRVCALKACGRIFISQPPSGGGPRPSYCTAEHREIAARLTGADRTAKWRKNQARKPK